MKVKRNMNFKYIFKIFIIEVSEQEFKIIFWEIINIFFGKFKYENIIQ